MHYFSEYDEPDLCVGPECTNPLRDPETGDRLPGAERLHSTCSTACYERLRTSDAEMLRAVNRADERSRAERKAEYDRMRVEIRRCPFCEDLDCRKPACRDAEDAFLVDLMAKAAENAF